MRLPRDRRRRTPAAAQLEREEQLGERLERGYRLACQLWIEHDIELAQDDLPAQAPAIVATAGADA